MNVNDLDVSIQRRLKRIRAIALDIDGVLTDGGLYYDEEGRTTKKFNSRDGMGIVMLQKAGYKIAFISGESSVSSMHRAGKLNVEDVHLGTEDKAAALSGFAAKYQLSLDEVAYVGDDLNDIPPLKLAGIAVAVADAAEEVKAVATIVTTRKGGDGAVREFAILLLNR